MKPEATVIYDGKKTKYQIDESAPLFGFIVKQLMAYTLSRDRHKLPDNVPLVMLLPKKAHNKVVKCFVKQNFAVEFKISDDWTYVWDFDDRARSGWWLDGKKEEGMQ